MQRRVSKRVNRATTCDRRRPYPSSPLILLSTTFPVLPLRPTITPSSSTEVSQRMTRAASVTSLVCLA